MAGAVIQLKPSAQPVPFVESHVAPTLLQVGVTSFVNTPQAATGTHLFKWVAGAVAHMSPSAHPEITLFESHEAKTLLHVIGVAEPVGYVPHLDLATHYSVIVVSHISSALHTIAIDLGSHYVAACEPVARRRRVANFISNIFF